MITQTEKPKALRKINIEIEKNNVKEIVEAIKHMDIESLDLFLDSKKKYQNFIKSEFLSMLNVVFETMKMEGDTFLEEHEGSCASCNLGNSGFTFVGNKSRKYFDMVFEKNKNGKLKDMFECNSFSNKYKNSFVKTECLNIDTDDGHTRAY